MYMSYLALKSTAEELQCTTLDTSDTSEQAEETETNIDEDFESVVVETLEQILDKKEVSKLRKHLLSSILK